MDKEIRNILQRATQDARRLLEEEYREQLEGLFDILLDGTIGQEAGPHLDATQRLTRQKVVAAIEHNQASGITSVEAVALYLREAAFTTLNRFAALKMLEARDLVQQCISKGELSAGFKEFSGLAPGLASLPDKGYRLYIERIFDEIGREVRVLFNRLDAVSQLWPRRHAFDALLDLLNQQDLAPVWAEDETIGWVYQYFNSQDERREMRKFPAPRNSRELAVRNQFFTPRYVVEFLTDNTLGRIWYEMRQGETALKEQCRYFVRRPNEVFLKEGDAPPDSGESETENLTQEELLQQPVYIPFRPKKDPREIRMLDPAGGSGHFGLYCFDLFLVIYAEAYDDPKLGPVLQRDYPDQTDYLNRVPQLILANNIHIIDIDPRAVQIAGLALWLRAQKAYNEMRVLHRVRPPITRTNVVVAEPMPGERSIFEEFLSGLREECLEGVMRRALGLPRDFQVRATKAVSDSLCDLARNVWECMTIAGEAGSLLKIELHIAEHIRKSRAAWEVESPLFLLTEFDLTHRTDDYNTGIQDVTGAPKDFWENAEDIVLTAMKEFVEGSSSAFMASRKLFADDAAQGFAFIDICRKRYDVVLMNPPFGEFAKGYKVAARVSYPNSYNDIFAAFTERWFEKLAGGGMLGAITSRVGFFLSSFKKWRSQFLFKDAGLSTVADLGDSVMDDATVESAAYILCRAMTSREATVFRMLGTRNPGTKLLTSIKSHTNGQLLDSTFVVNLSTCTLLPDSPLVYWVDPLVLRTLTEHTQLEPTIARVRQGLVTGDNPRFTRAIWEAPNRCLGTVGNFNCDAPTIWAPLVMKGPSQPFFSPITMVVNWRDEGSELKNFVDRNGKLKSRPQNTQFYFRSGFSWTRRAVRFIPYAVPSGCIPTASRYMAFPEAGSEYTLLGFTASNIVSAFLRFYGEWFCRPNFLVENVKAVPYPSQPSERFGELEDLVLRECVKRRRAYQNHEPFHEFTAPTLLFPNTDTNPLNFDLSNLLGAETESIVSSSYGFDDDTQLNLTRDLREAVAFKDAGSAAIVPQTDEDGTDDDDKEFVLVEDSRSRFEALVSYAIGCAFGRWDCRLALDLRLIPTLQGPFDPLPVCPPGMLVGPDGLPAESDRISSYEWLLARRVANDLPPAGTARNTTITDSEYPIPIVWDGIMVDDPGNPFDIETQIQQVVRVLCKEDWEAIMDQASEALGFSTPREYLRKSSGFFSDHIKRYSKSGRKAPIYFQLSTQSGGYSAWLYIHRLTRDTFYKLVNEYVAPRVRHEESRLAILIQESSVALTQSQRKAIADQESLCDELRAFRDEATLIAPLWNPDLNDGVIVNFAPLWRLVPHHRAWQKECKQCWDKLVKGECDWAHLAMHLWPERVLPKCAVDRSLALAHNLEEVFWEEISKGKWTPKPVSDDVIAQLIQERTSPSVKAALNDLRSAPVASSPTKTRAGRTKRT